MEKPKQRQRMREGMVENFEDISFLPYDFVLCCDTPHVDISNLHLALLRNFLLSFFNNSPRTLARLRVDMKVIHIH